MGCFPKPVHVNATASIRAFPGLLHEEDVRITIAITSKCKTKLDRFDEIGTRGNHNFENKFLDMVFEFFAEKLFINGLY